MKAFFDSLGIPERARSDVPRADVLIVHPGLLFEWRIDPTRSYQCVSIEGVVPQAMSFLQQHASKFPMIIVPATKIDPAARFREFLGSLPDIKALEFEDKSPDFFDIEKWVSWTKRIVNRELARGAKSTGFLDLHPSRLLKCLHSSLSWGGLVARTGSLHHMGFTKKGLKKEFDRLVEFGPGDWKQRVFSMPPF